MFNNVTIKTRYDEILLPSFLKNNKHTMKHSVDMIKDWASSIKADKPREITVYKDGKATTTKAK